MITQHVALRFIDVGALIERYILLFITSTFRDLLPSFVSLCPLYSVYNSLLGCQERGVVQRPLRELLRAAISSELLRAAPNCLSCSELLGAPQVPVRVSTCKSRSAQNAHHVPEDDFMAASGRGFYTFIAWGVRS